ncbi:MAG TPA: hypothetical protein VIQ97_01520, partial [Prevotella sp.]
MFLIDFLFAKIVQTSAVKASFQTAECSLSYVKIVQTSAVRAGFQTAECSLSDAKITKKRNVTNLCSLFEGL